MKGWRRSQGESEINERVREVDRDDGNYLACAY